MISGNCKECVDGIVEINKVAEVKHLIFYAFYDFWALTCSNFDKYLSTPRLRHWRTAGPFQHLCENDMLKILDKSPLWFENYLTWWYICSWTGIIHCPNYKSVCISGVFVWNNKIVFKITRRTENMRWETLCRISSCSRFIPYRAGRALVATYQKNFMDCQCLSRWMSISSTEFYIEYFYDSCHMIHIIWFISYK